MGDKERSRLNEAARIMREINDCTHDWEKLPDEDYEFTRQVNVKRCRECKAKSYDLEPKTTFDYDRDADILEVAIGSPLPWASREIEECPGLHIHYALVGQLVSKCVRGATVLFFSQQDKTLLQRLTPFPFDYGKVT